MIDDGKCPFCSAQVCAPTAEGPLVVAAPQPIPAKVIDMQEWLERKGFKPLGPKRNGVI